jgi:arylsulfatase A
MHVPLIAHWPGTIAPGSTRELINFTDFVPTLADVAEVSPEKRMQTDGISFYSTLRGREESRRAWMFVDYRDRKGTFPERRFTQDETYKLYNNGEFYNYMRDPSEENPLTKSDMSARAVRARTKLSEALEMMNQEVQNTLKKAPAASEDSTAQAQ